MASQTDSTGVDSLFPELLFGLLGHIGGAFVRDTVAHDDALTINPVQLSPLVDWIAPPEREQLNQLVSLGQYYSRLEAFVDDVADRANGRAYQCALANGIQELLDIYRSAILKLERRISAPPAPPLLAIRHHLAEFEVLLPEVAYLVSKIRHDALESADIMDFLHHRISCGVPAVKACSSRLLWHCHQVMLKQLESWVIYGELVDPGKEFFVRQNARESTTAHGASPQDETFSQLERFAIIREALPPDVPLSTAQVALFVGKAARILRKSVPSVGSTGTHVECYPEAVAFTQAIAEMHQHGQLRPALLAHALEKLRSSVAARLWSLVQEQGDLEGMLAAVRDFELLGRGEIYQQFLQESNLLLKSPPHPMTANADAGLAFSHAITHLADESWHRDAPDNVRAADASTLFSLRWFDLEGPVENVPSWHPACEPTLYPPSYDSWDGLVLEFAPRWPIALMFPPEILQGYSSMWQFMFRLKRVQLDLDAAWAMLSALSKPYRAATASVARSPRRVSAQTLTMLSQLRQRMAHFAANLALYLQVDVVQSAAATLRGRIAAARDFNQADSAHREFIGNIVAQGCLDVRQLMGAIQSIFGLCLRFKLLVEMLSADGGAHAPDVLNGARELNEAFRLKHNLVFQLLQSSTLQAGPRAVTLRQLILRLNFNEWCEKDVLSQLRST